MGGEPAVLAGAGQAGQHDHLGAGIVVDWHVRRTARVAQRHEAGVRRGERPRAIQDAGLAGELDEERGAIEDGLLVARIAAAAAARVCLGHEGQPVAAEGQAEPGERLARRGRLLLDEEERHLVVADQRGDVLAGPEGDPGPPEELADQRLAAHRMTARGDAAVRLGAGGGRLAEVVEQRAGEGDGPAVVVERAPGGDCGHLLDHHARVGPDVPLGVVVGPLRGGGEQLGIDEGLDRRPVDREGGRCGGELSHASISASGASWLGRIGRASQWLPESTTEVRKLARIHL